MKTRNGFVSNSSTSSFIVGFPKDRYYHTSDIHQILFPDKKYDDIISFSEWSVPIYCVTYVIFKQLKYKDPITTKRDFAKALYDNAGGFIAIPGVDNTEANNIWFEMCKKYGEDWDDEVYETPEYKKYLKVSNRFWKEENKQYRAKAQEEAEKHWPIFKKLNTYVIEYGDEEGVLGMIMEANDILQNIPHIDLMTH